MCAVTPWTGDWSITKAHCYEGNILEQGSNSRSLCLSAQDSPHGDSGLSLIQNPKLNLKFKSANIEVRTR